MLSNDRRGFFRRASQVISDMVNTMRSSNLSVKSEKLNSNSSTLIESTSLRKAGQFVRVEHSTIRQGKVKLRIIQHLRNNFERIKSANDFKPLQLMNRVADNDNTLSYNLGSCARSHITEKRSVQRPDLTSRITQSEHCFDAQPSYSKRDYSENLVPPERTAQHRVASPLRSSQARAPLNLDSDLHQVPKSFQSSKKLKDQASQCSEDDESDSSKKKDQGSNTIPQFGPKKESGSKKFTLNLNMMNSSGPQLQSASQQQQKKSPSYLDYQHLNKHTTEKIEQVENIKIPSVARIIEKPPSASEYENQTKSKVNEDSIIKEAQVLEPQQPQQEDPPLLEHLRLPIQNELKPATLILSQGTTQPQPQPAEQAHSTASHPPQVSAPAPAPVPTNQPQEQLYQPPKVNPFLEPVQAMIQPPWLQNQPAEQILTQNTNFTQNFNPIYPTNTQPALMQANQPSQNLFPMNNTQPFASNPMQISQPFQGGMGVGNQQPYNPGPSGLFQNPLPFDTNATQPPQGPQNLFNNNGGGPTNLFGQPTFQPQQQQPNTQMFPWNQQQTAGQCLQPPAQSNVLGYGSFSAQDSRMENNQMFQQGQGKPYMNLFEPEPQKYTSQQSPPWASQNTTATLNLHQNSIFAPTPQEQQQKTQNNYKSLYRNKYFEKQPRLG